MTKTFKLIIIGLWVAAAVLAVAVGRTAYVKWVNAGRVSATVTVEPARPFYRFHPRLGYCPASGRFKVTIDRDDLEQPYTFVADNNDQGFRRCRPAAAQAEDNRPEIWIFGCSITFGWALDNRHTYPWLVQAALPLYRVANFGVNGYGNIQALIQLRDLIAQGRRARAVVFTYGDLHLARNLATPFHLTGQAELDRYAGGRLRYPRAVVVPGRPVAVRLVPFTETGPEPDLAEQYRTAQAIFTDLAELCRRNGILPLLGFIEGPDNDPVVAKWRRDRGRVIDMRVDYTQQRYNLLPTDSHPNAAANRIYAQRITTALRSRLD